MLVRIHVHNVGSIQVTSSSTMTMSTISLTASNSDTSFTPDITTIAAIITTSHDAATIVASLMPSTTISHDTTAHVLCKLWTKYTSDIKIYA